MILCIAEKPSVAKDIAEILGAKNRKDGFWEGNGYWVSWTFGHLCTLKEPHDYNERWKYWRLEDLPIIPPSFGIKVVDDPGIQKQFSCIERLVQECDMVVNCGDAGQEGELIQRWVLLKAKCSKPTKRLWISSLTEEAIRDGFNQLKEASQYDRLYAAGSARAIGDWLLGINATRAFTAKFGKGKATLSIGRVQTPTLGMIVQRQKEINAFTSAEYWELKTTYRDTEFNCQIDRLTNEEKANKGLEYLKQHPFEVTSFEQKEGKEGNPRLFDLTALQVEANKKFGFSADDTLKLVQSLYEKKVVTYPRVDTTYLSEDIYPKVEGILKRMDRYQGLIGPIVEKPIPKLKSVFDDKKVTDHHAIIPTGVSINGITPAENQVYDLIARRFIGVFYPECKISTTTVLGKVGQLEFKTSGKQILEPGWRVVFEEKGKRDQQSEETEDHSINKVQETEEKVLPEFKEGESGPHKPFIHKGKTSPPKYYTEATLLRAMETAGKQVDDEEMRDLMKDNGIGRPSTRANIIETLYRRKYIAKQKKNIVATQTGMDLIDTIENELLKSPELTGQWERKIRLIEKGEYDAAVFKNELYQMVREVTDQVIFSTNRQINLVAQPVIQEKAVKEKRPTKEKVKIEELDCPKCKQAKIMKGKTAVGCGQFSVCGFKIPLELAGKQLTESQLIDLLTKRRTGIIKGFQVPGQDNPFQAKLILGEDLNVRFDT
jgi:DNA topoisomerase-3